MMPSLASSAAPAVTPAFARSRPCVLDPRLAFSALGPIAAARLSSECAVWLPREVREAMKSARAFRAHPDKLAPRVYGAQSRGLASRDGEIRSALGQWSAWTQGSLSTLRFFYLGENAGESVVPASVDRAVHERFEQLAAGLDAVAESAMYDLPRGEAITACFRDAAALCVALAPYGAFVLTALEADGKSAPAMCNYLDAWGLRVSDVTARAGADAEALRGLLATAGLGPIEWSGAHLAAIHFVPPSLLIEEAEGGDVSGHWERTACFWHRV